MEPYDKIVKICLSKTVVATFIDTHPEVYIAPLIRYIALLAFNITVIAEVVQEASLRNYSLSIFNVQFYFLLSFFIFYYDYFYYFLLLFLV